MINNKQHIFFTSKTLGPVYDDYDTSGLYRDIKFAHAINPTSLPSFFF